MSFSYNPYGHIELIKGEKGWYFYCHSCGKEDKEHQTYYELNYLVALFNLHLQQSHKKQPIDFQGWSNL